MVIALLLLVVVTTSLGILFYTLDGTVRVGRDLRHQLQAFYTCDGLDRVVVVLTDQYMDQATSPDAEDLEDWLCAQAGGCEGSDALPALVPDGYRLDGFEVQTLASGVVAPLPTGAFRGLLAEQTRVGITLEVGFDEPGEHTRCQVERELIFGRVLGTQFFLRSEGYTDWFPDSDLDIDARTHVNGSLCFGSSEQMRLWRVTATDALLHPSHADCLTNAGSLVSTAGIATDSDFTRFATWSEGTDHGCVVCGGSAQDWLVYAQLNWSGHALDGDHRVSALRPDVPTLPDVQFGADALGEPVDNGDTVRFLVEPLADSEDPAVYGTSLARQAHLRILNGTWYLPDPETPDSWPGVAIWSDHPGRTTTRAEEGVEPADLAVGQEDLRAELGWGSTTPRRFSFYGLDSDTGLLRNPTVTWRHVISYGALDRVNARSWEPGHWVTLGDDAMCTTGSAAVSGFRRAGQGLGCTAELPEAARVLNATRSGFHDPHVALRAPAVDSAEILPVNFDVGALLAALGDDGTGELGSYFCDAGDGCLMDEPFNGIVWISGTWPGSMAGQGTSGPLAAPIQGAQGPLAGTPQPTLPSHASNQQALPFPLCSTDPSAIGGPLTVGGSFVVPDCDDYGYGDDSASGAARPNAVRILHADDLFASSGGLPVLDRDGDGHADGLTIASNLPVYLLGGANETSVLTDGREGTWTPLLLAADRLTLQSTAWTDESSPWGSVAADTIGQRDAGATVLTLSVLAGWSRSAEDEASAFSGGVEGFLVTVEDWSNTEAEFRGSLDIGYASVHRPWPPADDEDAAVPPLWDMAYDPHLANPDTAPPGAAVYVLHTWSRWQGR